MIVHGRLPGTKYKHVEITLLKPYWNRRGITPFWITSSVTWSGDHAPYVFLDLTLFSVTIIGFDLYDTRHEEDVCPAHSQDTSN